MKKKAIVIQSGGMDSAICLAQAIKDWGRENILSVSFNYEQRHSEEIKKASLICKTWDVDHVVLDISCLGQITENALTNKNLKIQNGQNGEAPNTLVLGRNGLMAKIGAIHAHSLGAHEIYLGVIGVEGQYSGYRDVSREYMDKLQEILRWDLDDPHFTIKTPIVHMTKKESLELAHSLGVLDFLLQNTITCYEGIPFEGCLKCPACYLRNQGIKEYASDNPEFSCSFLAKIP